MAELSEVLQDLRVGWRRCGLGLETGFYVREVVECRSIGVGCGVLVVVFIRWGSGEEVDE